MVLSPRSLSYSRGAVESLVLLDPDLYLPNRFQFEEPPQSAVLLMWQRPNCLYPPHIVRTAMSKGIRMAHHVDIGVATGELLRISTGWPGWWLKLSALG